MNVILDVLMNGLMAGLLLATMVYCWRLNGRIKVLQDSKSELARIIREFDESTTRATQSIAEIHTATARLSENIQHKIDKANFLADDLQYMIDKGQKLAGKIDPAQPAPTPAPRAAREIEPPVAPRAARSTPAEAVEEKTQAAASRPARVRSRAEQEIMAALGGKPTPTSDE